MPTSSRDALPLLNLIAGAATTGLIEIRQIWPAGVAQSFHPVAQRQACAHELAERATTGDVYVGAALRGDRRGTAANVQAAWALWADCDGPESVERLATFATPTLTIGSGSGSNLHAWWLLREPLAAGKLKRALRRVAYALAADMRAAEPARVLRPPGTLNHKTTPPIPVNVVGSRGAVHNIKGLVGELPDPPVSKPAPRVHAAPRATADDPLRNVSAETYYRALTGWEVIPGRHVRCPFWDHQSPRPMMLYPDGTWYCWPCEAGGTIYDFAARLWGAGTWGDDFRRLQERLLVELGHDGKHTRQALP
ncbi:MAG: hypothetical protein ACREXY_09140 [Gammaproteobacteria bacterium]